MDCTSLSKVYYKGSPSDWDSKVTITEYNSCSGEELLNATRYYYSDTKPTTEGNYWHYVDGDIIEWGSPCENGHTWVQNCTSPLTCSVCGATKGEPLGQHTWSGWEVTIPQSCTEQGEVKRTCNCCGEQEIRNTCAIGHDYGDGGVVLVPTCTEKGYEEQMCLRCGELIKKEVSPLGHDWSEWYKDETTGEYRRECLRCGVEQTQPEECLTYTPLDDDTYEVSAADGVSGDIFIPSEYNEKPVISIADYAFLFRPRITSVIIANGITSIGSSAFDDCANITRVKIPSSVVDIGAYAFAKCPKLTTAVIPNGVSVIANGLFMNCRKLIGVNIPQGTTHIGNAAFYGCSSLEGVEIPDSVTTIGEGAFGSCLSITRIVIPSSVTRIGEGAFDLCNSLIYLYIGANVEKIGHSAFRGCSNLSIEVDENNKYYRVRDGCLWEIKTCTIIHGEYEEIPDETAAIGGGAFYGNTFFAPIKIPLSVTSIGSLAFGGKPVTVHVEATSKPEGWADDWCDENVEVVWGYTEGDTEGECSHKYGGWTITTPPTCTMFGNMQSTCSICGEVEMKPIAPLGHNYKEDVSDPTCTEKGSRTYTCSRCGHTYTEEIEAVGHSWNDWKIVLPAECEIDGQQERECADCGEIETEIIPALGHMDSLDTIQPTCEDGGYTKYTCIRCGRTYNSNFTDPLGHFIIDGVCVRCGHSEKGGVYYGVSAIPERYNSSFILGLEHQEAVDSHLDSITATPLADEYIYYCAPTSFGDCTFAYNNFVGGFTLIIEGLALTNAGGKTEAYNIYKSNQANLGVNGAITITIEETG